MTIPRFRLGQAWLRPVRLMRCSWRVRRRPSFFGPMLPGIGKLWTKEVAMKKLGP